jgi:hypothetical protein
MHAFSSICLNRRGRLGSFIVRPVSALASDCACSRRSNTAIEAMPK